MKKINENYYERNDGRIAIRFIRSRLFWDCAIVSKDWLFALYRVDSDLDAAKAKLAQALEEIKGVSLD